MLLFDDWTTQIICYAICETLEMYQCLFAWLVESPKLVLSSVLILYFMVLLHCLMMILCLLVITVFLCFESTLSWMATWGHDRCKPSTLFGLSFLPQLYCWSYLSIDRSISWSEIMFRFTHGLAAPGHSYLASTKNFPGRTNKSCNVGPRKMGWAKW